MVTDEINVNVLNDEQIVEQTSVNQDVIEVGNQVTKQPASDDIKKLKKQIREKEAEEEIDKLAQVIKSMGLETPKQIAEFVRDFRASALNQKFDGDALLVFTSITKIRKTVGLLQDDKIMCEFYINDKILYVPMEKTKTPQCFLDQYARMFDVWLNIKSAVWQNMMNALFKEKMETVDAVEESEHVFVARQTWSKICKFKVSDDPTGYKANKGILKYEGGYFVSSEAITKLTEKTKIRTSDLSTAMTQLGMKYPGTTKKLGIRCWQLEESTLRIDGVI